MIDSWVQHSKQAAQSLRVRSALNPALWLTAIVTPTCLVSAYGFRDNVPIVVTLLIGALLPVFVACGVFVYFAVSKPEKLQSEDYQLRHESLQLIQAKTGTIAVDTTSITAIANPALPALPAPNVAEAE